MKREDLEALGMTKEQIDKVLDLHHTEYDPVRKDLDIAKADLTAEKEKTATQETTIAGLNKDLEEFKDADVSGLQNKITNLENDIKTIEATHQQEISDRDFNDLLKESISSAKGLNPKAITSLLDVDTLKASKNQKEDIAAALKALTEKEDSKMLFGEPEPNPVGTGNLIGLVSRSNTSQVDTLNSAIAEHYKK